ncbi:hypothetical protein Pint_13016 [Pistacia integerrima]|uniref:Uncharacterized protein n=1 Tax=Pistacia integerrima TaxID=434235 RepID=A0ACC0Y8N1_9ROSI|nr:hypothetical protein Pint_13016 [Pistacia integerrima]
MVQSKKFRGVRQRHWGSWVSEIRHPLFKAPSPSMTCLRLDTENSHIGVWQKRAGQRSDSNWVMTVQLGKNNADDVSGNALPLGAQSEEITGPELKAEMDEEERIALQMIEELLNRNCPSPSFGVEDGGIYI